MTTQNSAATTTVASASSIDLGDLLEPIKVELAEVENFLNQNLVDDSAFIADLLRQVFQSGGKRIRPALCLLAAKATLKNSEFSRRHIILAVLTELIHTASLVHDDVIDAASTRRGQETVNRKWNDKLAVLIGDLLFAQASVCLARLGSPPVVGIYGHVLGDLCAGEMKQMRQQFSTTVDWAAYEGKNIWKTASLIAAGCHAAPILNTCGDDVVASMKDYGTKLGICFQVVDDLLDFTQTSAQLGKPAGSDLANGLVTAPALFVLERKDARAARLENLINTRAVCQPEGLGEALALIKGAGGIEATAKMAAAYATSAKQALAIIAPSPARDSLELLSDWLLTRTK